MIRHGIFFRPSLKAVRIQIRQSRQFFLLVSTIATDYILFLRGASKSSESNYMKV